MTVFVQDFTLRKVTTPKLMDTFDSAQFSSHQTSVPSKNYNRADWPRAREAKTFFQFFFVLNFYLTMSEDIFMVRFSSTHRSS